MGMGSQNNRGGALADINVTPLVDVLLVLLIIFMVTAPMIHHGQEVDTPPDPRDSKPQKQDDEEKQATVYLDAKGQLSFRKKNYTLKDLSLLLRKDQSLRKSREVNLRADPSLTYGRVMEVMAMIRRSGMTKVGLVVEPEDVEAPPAKR